MSENENMGQPTDAEVEAAYERLRDWVGDHWCRKDWGIEGEKLHEAMRLVDALRDAGLRRIGSALPSDEEIEAWFRAWFTDPTNDANGQREWVMRGIALMRRARRAPVPPLLQVEQVQCALCNGTGVLEQGPVDGRCASCHGTGVREVVMPAPPSTAPAGLGELQERARAYVKAEDGPLPEFMDAEDAEDIVRDLAALPTAAEPAAPASPGLLAAAEDIAFNHGSFSDYVRRRDALVAAIAAEKARPQCLCGQVTCGQCRVDALRAERDEYREKLERAEAEAEVEKARPAGKAMISLADHDLQVDGHRWTLARTITALTGESHALHKTLTERVRADAAFLREFGAEHNEGALDCARRTIAELRAERDRLREKLESSHGGECTALLSELDEARAERDELRARMERDDKVAGEVTCRLLAERDEYREKLEKAEAGKAEPEQPAEQPRDDELPESLRDPAAVLADTGAEERLRARIAKLTPEQLRRSLSAADSLVRDAEREVEQPRDDGPLLEMIAEHDKALQPNLTLRVLGELCRRAVGGGR